jgi:ABC-type ATPase involved in cell division
MSNTRYGNGWWGWGAERAISVSCPASLNLVGNNSAVHTEKTWVQGLFNVEALLRSKHVNDNVVLDVRVFHFKTPQLLSRLHQYYPQRYFRHRENLPCSLNLSNRQRLSR